MMCVVVCRVRPICIHVHIYMVTDYGPRITNAPQPTHTTIPTTIQGFLRHYGLEQPLTKRTKSVRLEDWTVEFAPPFKHEALRYAFLHLLRRVRLTLGGLFYLIEHY